MHDGILENLKSRSGIDRAGREALAQGSPGEGTGRREPAPPPDARRVFPSSFWTAGGPLFWQRAILIQDGRDTGLSQAPARSPERSPSATRQESYKGHVIDLQIKTFREDSVGSVAHKILHECYPDGSCVPSSDTLHYIL